MAPLNIAMSNTPPPYTNITGISRAVMKDNAQETLTNYNGNARPGELVVDLTQDPPPLYVGNNAGALTLVASGGGGLPLNNGDSGFAIPVASGNVEIIVDDSYFWIFDTTGNLNIPSNIVSGSTIRIDNTASGNTADIQLLSADDILLQGRDRTVDSSSSEGGDVNIFAGDGRPGIGDDSSGGGDIQIIAGVGGSSGDFDSASSGGFITIQGGEGGLASAVDSRSAASGGPVSITAGSAGNADGDDTLGSSGGGVTITAGDSTGNGIIGGSIQLNTGQGGPTGSAGEVEINIPASDAGPGGTWNFDYTATLSVPGSIQLKNFDSTTSRDTAIPSPATGMLIYVAGVGMQVYGATQWNTVSGTDT